MPPREPTSGDPNRVASWHGAFALIPENLVHYSLSGKAIKVYIGLSLYADRRGESFPSLGTLAVRSGISVSSAQRGLAELKAKGLVQVVYRTRSTGGQTSNLYRLVRP